MGVGVEGSPGRSRSTSKASEGHRNEVTINYPQGRSSTSQGPYDGSTDDYSREGYFRDDYARDDSPALSTVASSGFQSVSSYSSEEALARHDPSRVSPPGSRVVHSDANRQPTGSFDTTRRRHNSPRFRNSKINANASFYTKNNRRSDEDSDEDSLLYVSKSKRSSLERARFCSGLSERQARILEQRPDYAYNRTMGGSLGVSSFHSHRVSPQRQNTETLGRRPPRGEEEATRPGGRIHDSSQQAPRPRSSRDESAERILPRRPKPLYLRSTSLEASKSAVTSPRKVHMGGINTPHLDTLHDQKVDYLGRLQSGRKYACRTHSFRFSQPPGQLYVRAQDCAWLLGLRSATKFIESHPDLRVILATGEAPSSRSSLGENGFVLAKDAFEAFGHRLVKHGRPVFDDYFEPGSNVAGLEDNTLWGAAQGSLDAKGVSYLLSLGQLDFDKPDSTSTSPLDYMAKGLRTSIEKNGTVGGDPGAEMLWRAAMKSASRPQAEDSLRDVIDDAVGIISSKLSTKHLHILVSAHEFCMIIGLFEEDQESSQYSLNDRSLEKSESRSHVLVSQWEIPSLLENQRTADDSRSTQDIFGRSITFAGGIDKFSCCNCSDYLSQRWGTIGLSALSLICKITEHLLYENEKAVSGIITQRGQLISQRVKVLYAASRNHFAIHIHANHGYISDVIEPLFEALTWACSALRPVLQTGVTGALLRSSKSRKNLLSTKPIQMGNTPFTTRSIVLIKLSPLVRRSVDPLSRCWLKLFTTFPVVDMEIHRPWGRGLQITFSLMVELSAVENVCSIEGRIARLGPYTALIPTEETNEGDCLQWHLEVSSPSEGLLLPSQLLQRLQSKPWIKVDLQEMHKKTCFLGWCHHADILLGTKSFLENHKELKSPKNLEFAKSRLDKDTVEAGFQISLGIPGIEPILKGSKGWKYRDNTIARTPVEDYRMSLQFARRKTCLLVDSQSKQAWLIPVLSVVLHLCHLFYVMNSIGTTPTPIPYAQPSSDGDLAVLEAIGDSADLEVLGSRFSAIFHQQYCNLMDHPRLGTSSFLYANDLLHSLENKRTYPRKVPLASAGFAWPDLLPFGTAADVVAVASNIGQVLQPIADGGSRQCSCVDSSCHQLPVGCCYLAAHVPSLRYLCDLDEVISTQRCKFMLSNASWVIKADPWQLRPCGGASIWSNALTTGSVLQQTGADVNNRLNGWIRERRNGHARRVTPIIQQIPSKGIVVFGRQA